VGLLLPEPPRNQRNAACRFGSSVMAIERVADLCLADASELGAPRRFTSGSAIQLPSYAHGCLVEGRSIEDTHSAARRRREGDAASESRQEAAKRLSKPAPRPAARQKRAGVRLDSGKRTFQRSPFGAPRERQRTTVGTSAPGLLSFTSNVKHSLNASKAHLEAA
jgi:hypothetical protein